MILTIACIIAFTILVSKKPIIQIFPDGIYIKDFLYPSMIPNDSIKSVKLVYGMPKVTMRSNGYGGAFMWKGFFRIKDYRKRAVLYLENHYKAPFIEIQTTQDLYFINCKSPEQTTQLFDEMNATVKLVDESILVDMKTASQKRSIVVVVVFLVVLLIPSVIIPLLLS
ncbi:MAG: hypothetical protein IJT45_04155 [Bacteroidales bacterium]|nr:hypothetical protein [Bacteroidales bacterium]